MTSTEVAERDQAIPADTFAARLMLTRLHAGNLTIRDAASRCGIKHESWSGWERGGRPRDLADVVDRISAELGVDRMWLLFGGPLAKEERRPGRVLSRDRKEGVVPQPNVFYAAASDHTMRHLPTPASQGSPRLSFTVSNKRVTPSSGHPSAPVPSQVRRRTARRNRPNP